MEKPPCNENDSLWGKLKDIMINNRIFRAHRLKIQCFICLFPESGENSKGHTLFIMFHFGYSRSLIQNVEGTLLNSDSHLTS